MMFCNLNQNLVIKFLVVKSFLVIKFCDQWLICQ